MHSALRIAETVWGEVRRLAETAIIVLSLAMVASSTAQVVARYVFNAPLTWSEELSRYLFVWLSFLGAWFAWARREHIGIEALATAAPPRIAAALRALSEVSVVAFAVCAMIFGRRILEISVNQPSAVLRLPMVWVYAAFYVGMTLIVIETIAGWLRAPGSPDAEAAR